MSFQFVPLSRDRFAPLFALSDAELKDRGVLRQTVTSPNSTPCRISLADAEPGERVLLLNFEHQPALTPYRATHAIFVREAADEATVPPGSVPACITPRLISARGFSGDDTMIDADVAQGRDIAPVITRLFENPDIAYLHLHNAKQGCFAARVNRA